jgi:hypothetical protein
MQTSRKFESLFGNISGHEIGSDRCKKIFYRCPFTAVPGFLFKSSAGTLSLQGYEKVTVWAQQSITWLASCLLSTAIRGGGTVLQKIRQLSFSIDSSFCLRIAIGLIFELSHLNGGQAVLQHAGAVRPGGAGLQGPGQVPGRHRTRACLRYLHRCRAPSSKDLESLLPQM